MFSKETLIQSALNLVIGVIEQGGHIISTNAMVKGDKETKTFVFLKKDGIKYNPIYEGINAEKATLMYIETVGVLNAFGDAVKWHRNSRSEREKQIIEVLK